MKTLSLVFIMMFLENYLLGAETENYKSGEKSVEKPKINILFLCTGNSCRSQMAEGLANHFKGEMFNFYSAGTEKHGLNPRAVEVMHEIEIDISNHLSKTLDEISHIKMDIIFTVCSNAQESCPNFGEGKVIHVSFDDPPKITESMDDDEEILEIYRRVRDQIREFIENIESKL